MDAFIAENADPEAESCFLFAGHSRGACISNLLGTRYEKRGKKSFTYDFCTSGYTADSEAGNYRTIFNLF